MFLTSVHVGAFIKFAALRESWGAELFDAWFDSTFGSEFQDDFREWLVGFLVGGAEFSTKNPA